MTKPDNKALEAAAQDFALGSGYRSTYDRMRLFEGYVAGANWAVDNDPRVLALVKALTWIGYMDGAPKDSWPTLETCADVANKALEEWEAGLAPIG